VAALCLLWAGGLQPLPSSAWDSQRMQAAAQSQGPAATAALADLQALLLALPAMGSDAQRLQAVNQFFNRRIRFHSDFEVWGQEDHWATPLELLQKGQGDCEDYAIAKYATLRASGMQVQRLRLVYVRAEMPGHGRAQAHMVLAYYASAREEPLILDNLRPEVQPASERTDLQPVFSFNSEGLWQGAGQAPAGDPLARLSRWRDVWAKILEEGF